MQRTVKISIKAILAGGAADLLSTAVFSGLLASYIVIHNGITETRPEILGPRINDLIHASTVLFGAQTVIGITCSILGGYVAARVAKQDEIVNAIAASLTFVGLGIYTLIFGSEESALLNAFSTLITPFFYRMGAQVRVKQVAKRT